MYTNVNLAAPLGALALLGTVFILGIAVLAFLYTLIKRKFSATRVVLLAAAVVAAIYLGVVLIFSFNSSEQVLARGQEKHFCELDCHLAYSIVDVRQVKTLGEGPQQTTAAGWYYLITMKTRFDENTISSTRGNSPLKPNSRVATVIDDQGRRYPPAANGQSALLPAGSANTPLTTPLRPGETYTTTLVFDLPTDIRNPTLLVNEGEWLTRFVIGHENSPLHKKTRFQL